MTQYATLCPDLDKHYNKFQLIIKKYDSVEKSNKDLLDLISNLKYINNSSKENERKCNQQLEVVRNICNNQEKTISQLYVFEEKNKNVIKENEALQNIIENLNSKMNEVNQVKDATLLKQSNEYKEELENNKKHAEKQVQDLQNQLEVVQAGADLQIYDLQNEINTLTKNYEAQLKQANDKEQQLNSQITMLNNNMSSSIGVYQKKVFEIEEKVKSLERERSLYLATKGSFVTAQSILNLDQSKGTTINNQTTEVRNNNAQNITKAGLNCLEETNKTGTDSIKKFKFRNNLDANKKMSELSLKPNTTLTKNHFTQNYLNRDLNMKLNLLHSNFEKPKSNIETNSLSHHLQVTKRRKLYDPNNYDYLPNVD